MNKRKRRFFKENIKKKHHLTRETLNLFHKLILYTENIKAGKKALAYADKTRKKNKNKLRSIALQTSLCMETGHYKSRINWGKLSRFSFKSTGNKDFFSNLQKLGK